MPYLLAEPPLDEDSSGLVRLVRPTPVQAAPQAPPHSERLRAAARQLDRSREALDEAAADKAFGLWEGLVQGRWKLVDWFDSDGRRFIIAKLNTPTRGCPRGLTTRERQVALCAALGESSKLTGYRLGISPSRVSALLKAAMRKLGVRTKVQLVVMVRILSAQSRGALAIPSEGGSHNG
jgi:DNA-binding CsgD family transcriptional regulator